MVHHQILVSTFTLVNLSLIVAFCLFYSDILAFWDHSEDPLSKFCKFESWKPSCQICERPVFRNLQTAFYELVLIQFPVPVDVQLVEHHLCVVLRSVLAWRDRQGVFTQFAPNYWYLSNGISCVSWGTNLKGDCERSNVDSKVHGKGFLWYSLHLKLPMKRWSPIKTKNRSDYLWNSLHLVKVANDFHHFVHIHRSWGSVWYFDKKLKKIFMYVGSCDILERKPTWAILVVHLERPTKFFFGTARLCHVGCQHELLEENN